MVTHYVMVDTLKIAEIHLAPDGKYRIISFNQIGGTRKGNTLEYCLKRIKRVAPKAIVVAV